MTTFPMEKTNLKKYQSTENAFLQKVATIPLVQGDGTECKSLVNVGDVVSEGDVIGIPMTGADLSKTSKIHSPIPGKVIAIVPCVIASGEVRHAVQIKLEGKFSYLGKKLEAQDWKLLTPTNIVDQFYESGLINTFTASDAQCLGYEIDQINGNTNKKSSAVVVRLFDEDPLRIADSLVTHFYFDKVRTAAQICAKAIKTKNILYLVSNQDNDEMAEALNITEFLPKGKKNESKDDFIEEYVIISPKKYPYSKTGSNVICK